MSRSSVTKHLSDKILKKAEQDGRFSPQRAELHLINRPAKSQTGQSSGQSPGSGSSPYCRDTVLTSLSRTADQIPVTFIGLRCIFQNERPEHTSGLPDKLPFENAAELRTLLEEVQLPSLYLQVADGLTGIALGRYANDSDGKVCNLDFVANCVSKQGDWTIALSPQQQPHGNVNVLWTIDRCIDASDLLGQLHTLRDYTVHPMLIPCIMLNSMMEANSRRRHHIKRRLHQLEDEIRNTRFPSQQATAEPRGLDRWYELPDRIQPLLDILHDCKRDQDSREGRYEFWRSLYSAIHEGFRYTENVIASTADNGLEGAHAELKQWSAFTWQKLESIKARDKDHGRRVDDVSDMLYHLIQQRDNILQASIARATQRDSEDMKFIALLGSIFLPASLVATILNVPEFQFLRGANLFYAYLGITIPFIALVVTLCIARPQYGQWRQRKFLRPQRIV